MLALRTAAGLPLSLLRTLSPDAPVDTLLAEGALLLLPASSHPASLRFALSQSIPAAASSWVRIPEDHFFVSDSIIARLFPTE